MVPVDAAGVLLGELAVFDGVVEAAPVAPVDVAGVADVELPPPPVLKLNVKLNVTGALFALEPLVFVSGGFAAISSDRM